MGTCRPPPCCLLHAAAAPTGPKARRILLLAQERNELLLLLLLMCLLLLLVLVSIGSAMRSPGQQQLLQLLHADTPAAANSPQHLQRHGNGAAARQRNLHLPLLLLQQPGKLELLLVLLLLMQLLLLLVLLQQQPLLGLPGSGSSSAVGRRCIALLANQLLQLRQNGAGPGATGTQLLQLPDQRLLHRLLLLLHAVPWRATATWCCRRCCCFMGACLLRWCMGSEQQWQRRPGSRWVLRLLLRQLQRQLRGRLLLELALLLHSLHVCHLVMQCHVMLVPQLKLLLLLALLLVLLFLQLPLLLLPQLPLPLLQDLAVQLQPGVLHNLLLLLVAHSVSRLLLGPAIHEARGTHVHGGRSGRRLPCCHACCSLLPLLLQQLEYQRLL